MKKPASISRLLAIYLVCTGAFVLLTIVGCSSSLTASINKPTAATSSTAPTAAPTATLLPTTTMSALVTATPPAPTPTDTPPPTSIPPLRTASATLPAPMANTLLLYTTPVVDPSGQTYWAFRTSPRSASTALTAHTLIPATLACFLPTSARSSRPTDECCSFPAWPAIPNMALRAQARGG